MFLNFGTILMDGKMNNIIILRHQKPWCFSQFKSSKWAPVFVLNLKYWYLSKMISFLKCSLIPTFLLLIKARRCDQKTETFSLKDPFASEFLLYFFCMPVNILSLISIKTTEGHMWNCIIFYFLKKKKWNEMKWEWNLVLNNEMRMNDMKTKPCI